VEGRKPDVEIDLRIANLKNADLAEAKKGGAMTDMPGEEVWVVKQV